MLRIGGGISDFETVCSPLKTRAILHRCTVFRQSRDGKAMFVGSGMRSAMGMLERLPRTQGLSVSSEFFLFASKLPGMPVTFDETPSPGMPAQAFFSDTGHSKPVVSLLQSDDPEVISSVGSRLAMYLGPFALAIAKGAAKKTHSAFGMVESLCLEIPAGKSRVDFERDAMSIIGEIAKKRGLGIAP